MMTTTGAAGGAGEGRRAVAVAVDEQADAGTAGGAAGRPVLRGPRGARGEVRRRITEAALRSFSDHGLDGASTRSIARDADCDPALVRYYFTSKQDLFDQVVRRPGALDRQLEEMASLPRAERAAFLADLVERCWDDPVTGPFWRSLLRTAATDHAVARQLEDTWSEFVALGVVRELTATPGQGLDLDLTAAGGADGDGTGSDGAHRDGAIRDGAHLDGARVTADWLLPDVVPRDAARRDGPLVDGGGPHRGGEEARRHGVLALSSITGMLAAVHVWSSRRAGDLTAQERSAALAEVLGLCFTDPAER